jgi:protein-S-isoprenylcysteine O-methyltransferase Ste14/uncharacterized membrane protein (UPF0127 family)
MAVRLARARVRATGAVVAERLRVARSHWSRLKGLLGTTALEPGDGLWLVPCSQVHTIGMRYGLDLVFLDERQRVVGTVAALPPGRISGRVRGARSVLELPVGTLAQTGVGAGAEIEIEGQADAGARRPLRHLAGNLGLAAVYLLFASAHVAVARRTGMWLALLPIVAQEALLVALFLTRRRSIATSARPLDWVVGIVGTFLPLLMRPTEPVGSLAWLGAPLQALGLVLAIAATAVLGRSLGVVAGNRGIETRGLYRLVRHPMYGAYALSYLGYIASYPSAANLTIAAAVVAALNLRAIVEERFLAAADPAYRAYLGRVRWRLVPRVY